MQGLFIKTYGCQMNVYDSLMIGSVIKPLGFEIVDDINNAKIVVLNTCHIREKAAEKLYSELGCIRKIKESKELVIVVAGCVAQAEGEEVFKRAPFVDIVVGPQSIHTLPELITKVVRGKGKELNIDFPEISKFDVLAETNFACEQKVSAFVSVQEGCDKFCTFCVVPYTRGAEYSRPVNEVVREVLALVESGVKEITLLGQNVNAYHGKLDDGCDWNLGDLINHLTTINGLERIRYTTSHPRDMHKSLYDAHKNKKLMPFLHLPVQSGSNKVLSVMNRKHNIESYLQIIDDLRQCRPDIAFSSDFIVGFPGETEKDFEDTLKVVETVGYAQAYSFKYSPRPGTPGAEFKNQIPEDIKSQRLQILQQLINKKQLEYNQSMVGKELAVLFDGKIGKLPGQIIGKTEYMQSVYVNDCFDQQYYGEIVKVKIIQGYQNSLLGEIVKVG